MNVYNYTHRFSQPFPSNSAKQSSNAEAAIRMPIATLSKASESDYFDSSVTYDVQTIGKRTIWSETTDDMDTGQDPNTNTGVSSETKSVNYINEVIDRDIKSRKPAESWRKCQWSMCTTREAWIDQLHRPQTIFFVVCTVCTVLTKTLLHSSEWHMWHHISSLNPFCQISHTRITRYTSRCTVPRSTHKRSYGSRALRCWHSEALRCLLSEVVRWKYPCKTALLV